MAFGLFFIVPFIVSIILFVCFNKQITIKEFLVQTAVQLLLALIMIFSIYHVNTSDVEILSSEVTNKRSERVSCSHSYRCHCYTTCSGSGSNKSCSEHCSTCYEHSYDVDWIVDSGIGSTEIERVSRQGLEEPPRYTKVKIGEPFAKEHSYENYIKGNPETLFRKQGLVEKYQKHLPKYFGNVYDYYRINRFINLSSFKTKNISDQIAIINKEIGSIKQGTVGVVIVSQPRDYFYALQEHWLGGKKNDIIPVISVDTQGNIEWVEIMTWTTNPLFQIKLRDAILDLKQINDQNLDLLIDQIKINTLDHYKRKPMKDFEYLKASIRPTILQFTIGSIIALLVSFGLSYWFFKEDVFEENRAYKF